MFPVIHAHSDKELGLVISIKFPVKIMIFQQEADGSIAIFGKNIFYRVDRYQMFQIAFIFPVNISKMFFPESGYFINIQRFTLNYPRLQYMKLMKLARSLLQVIVSINSFLLPYLSRSKRSFVFLSANTLVFTTVFT